MLQWANRRDILSLLPGWTSMVETQIAETVRARCMVTFVSQAIDSAYITMPVDFATMESIRDATTGEMLVLKDEWSGSWTQNWPPPPYSSYEQVNPMSPATAYRLLANCVEFLPHPIIPNPPLPGWVPQQVLMGYYARPTPLVLPSDTNAILETFYGIYLFGLLKVAAVFEREDQDTIQSWDTEWQRTVTQANLWKQQSDYSGAPFREEMAVHF